MAILRKFSNHEKERSTIHRSGGTENFFGDSSGRRTTVNSAPSFWRTVSANFRPLYPPSASIFFNRGEAALHLVNNAIRTDTVMDIRLVNHHAHRKPKYVKHNMFLAPFNPLAAVDPTIGVNMMGGLDASGINDAETGGSSRPSACGPSDGAYPSVPQTRLHVSTCWSSRRRYCRAEGPWQHTPLAACLQYKHDGIHDVSEGVLSFLCCGSRIFSVTCHCLSVRLVGYWLVALIDWCL